MLTTVTALVEQLRDTLRGFDPCALEPIECAALVGEFAIVEKLCAAARAATALRAAQCGAHGGLGFSDAADWLARATGSSRSEARAELAAISAVESCPTTRDLLSAGEISLVQAGEIASAVRDTPEAEAELLDVARNETMSALKDRARSVRMRGIDVDELHRRQHTARSFRSWRDALGMVCFTGALPPGTGVPLINRLDVETDRVFRASNRNGDREPREAYAADAFVAMVTGGGGKPHATNADLVIVADLTTYRRRRVDAGGTCHIVGGGPIPVEIAKELAKDAFLKVVLHDGVNVHTIKHFGRRYPAELRTALELGAPPEFDGRRCRRCGNRFRIQTDHRDPVANRGPTSLTNLDDLCPACHREKTEQDRRAGLLGADPATAYTSSPPKRRNRPPPKTGE